jgi:aminoglycoside phosphotransferase (APT) family kinase protein
MTKAAPSTEQVEALLRDLHGEAVEGLEPLAGGFWSSAFAYRLGGRELVLRLGGIAEGYEMDRDAMAFHGPDLPVPSVLAVGTALGLPYAVSERHHGRYLEGIRPDEADAAGPAVMRMLAALRRIPSALDAPAEWRPAGPPEASTWHRWLTGSLEDDPRRPVSGWRRTLADDPDLDRLFNASAARVRSLADSCPERRDVVHGDLLHGNVLVSEDASRIEAVFSWKCSVRGDFLYDVAWCTFWGAWHPGIAALDVWTRLLDGGSDEDDRALVDAAARHHCYELQIGATHLGWYAWTGDQVELRAAARHTAQILERGPLR